jgi:osmotically-inducible protein OsmY
MLGQGRSFPARLVVISTSELGRDLPVHFHVRNSGGPIMLRIATICTVLCAITLLAGCAPALVAGAAAGAAVATDRRTLGSMIDDESIELKSGAAIASDAELRDAIHINVTSMNGIVLLTGEAPTADLRDAVLRHLREVNGVRRITNEMRIAEPSSIGSRSKDSLITSAVKSRLLITKGADPARVKVVTENGVVYLMGIVSHESGDLAAEQATTIEGVERVVKIFEYND